MRTSIPTPTSAYRNAGVDAAVATASPHELILMLFRGARTAIAQARHAFARGDVPARGKALSKASAIIDDGLRASLDLTKGGDLAAQLEALYQYAALQLALANAENESRRLEETDRLLAGLEESWRQIGAQPQTAPAVVPAPVPAPAHRPSLSYGKA